MGAYYGNANMIMDNTYHYDQSGNMIYKNTLAGETQYTYDQLNQLTDVVTRNQREHYTYDPVGNRLEKKVTDGNQAIIERYAYDNRNRMLQRDVYKEAGLGLGDTYAAGGRNVQELTAQYIYAYDAQGNMLSETMFHATNSGEYTGASNSNSHSRTFSYDAMNRLTEVTDNKHLIQRNIYDAEGLRSEMEENGRLISFLFDGDKAIAESDGTTGMKRYIRGYELVSSECEQARTYYHYTSDHLGSITDVIAPTGEVCNHYEYDAFGNFTFRREQVENRFGYAGEQLDLATNLYYLRARFYSPVIARFIQEDSYLGDGLNLYAYVKNNPVMYVDPSGHYCEPKYETPQSGVGGEGTSGAPKKQWSTPEFETLNISETGNIGGNGTSGGNNTLLQRIKTKIFKQIDVDAISYNPNDDVFKRGFNEESVSYQRKYYAENGMFDCSQEPIIVYDVGNGQFMMQGGHHRLKAAKDLGLNTIKVNEIIPYEESVRLGITELPLGKIPKSY